VAVAAAATLSMLIKSASTPTAEMAQRILSHNQISFPFRRRFNALENYAMHKFI